mmetsp:Transcript_54370/g.129892  ORF Transcript_54370/g.129892 Transcript_54370/m.129892 type:complete len:208 (-) Transcript_54370:1036-1659(-)
MPLCHNFMQQPFHFAALPLLQRQLDRLALLLFGLLSGQGIHNFLPFCHAGAQDANIGFGLPGEHVASHHLRLALLLDAHAVPLRNHLVQNAFGISALKLLQCQLHRLVALLFAPLPGLCICHLLPGCQAGLDKTNLCLHFPGDKVSAEHFGLPAMTHMKPVPRAEDLVQQAAHVAHFPLLDCQPHSLLGSLFALLLLLHIALLPPRE